MFYFIFGLNIMYLALGMFLRTSISHTNKRSSWTLDNPQMDGHVNVNLFIWHILQSALQLADCS